MSRDAKVEKVCDSKKMYDTEFEAMIATSRVPFEAKAYQCPGTHHWHIAHVNREESLGYGYKLMECPKCHELVKRKGASKHIKKCNGSKQDIH